MTATLRLLGLALGVLALGSAAPGVPQTEGVPCDPSIAVERRDELEAESLGDAEVYFGGRKLDAGFRERFFQILRRPESFYACPGVIGCVGDEFRIRLVTAERSMEGMFSQTCRRVFPPLGVQESEGLDLVLSKEGASALRELGDEVLKRR